MSVNSINKASAGEPAGAVVMTILSGRSHRDHAEYPPDRVYLLPLLLRRMSMTLYNEEFRPKAFYSGLVKTGCGKASDCIACGQCESVCPQHLPIIELMKEAAERLDKE